jgi:hypothetical protein
MAGSAVVCVSVTALWALTAPTGLVAAVRSGGLQTGPIDARIATFCALAAWACAGWLALAAAATVLARIPGQAGRFAAAVAGRITPALVRRAVEAAVGAAVATSSVAAVTAPAAAAPVSAPASGGASDTSPARRPGAIGDRVVAPQGVSAGPQDPFDRPAGPRRPADPPQPRPAPPAAQNRPAEPPQRTPRADAPDGEVVVLRGDTLWSIAAERLEAGAGDAAIAAEWPRWYAANRERIGTDPDLIRPGQRLVPPPRAEPTPPTPGTEDEPRKALPCPHARPGSS